jgi:hypothetical protein
MRSTQKQQLGIWYRVVRGCASKEESEYAVAIVSLAFYPPAALQTFIILTLFCLLAAICFLTRHSTETTKMQLVILCRTQGRNMADFMFREGSNVAIRILDNVACEAAGLAYKELLIVAERLRKDALWKSFSSIFASQQRTRTPPRDGIDEMLQLATVRPLIQILGNGLSGSYPELVTLLARESDINWTMLCKSMKQDPLFSPCWSMESDDSVTHLFYMQAEDVFWLLRENSNGTLLHVDLVEKDDSGSIERRQMAILKLANYLFHFLWKSL